MKRGFTLLELVVVIIILGILATLGVQQYGRIVEKARGAEAKTILGQLRTQGAAYYMENQNTSGFDNADAGIGTSTDQAPSACRSSHYFNYTATASAPNNVTFKAMRCTTGGKTPGYSSGGNMSLLVDYKNGADTWNVTDIYK